MMKMDRLCCALLPKMLVFQISSLGNIQDPVCQNFQVPLYDTEVVERIPKIVRISTVLKIKLNRSW